ncbi:hypothetical protein EON65_01050 [archaeon]|nr:MAG: hypothetical protein EON65_01050 [archaeon]
MENSTESAPGAGGAGGVNRMAGDWRSEILSNRNKDSVKEISSRFKGTSKIETLEANQKRLRTYRKIPSLSMFGTDSHKIKALTSPSKIHLMNKWSKALKSDNMGEVSAESAKDFLAHYGVTEDKVDDASWKEWIDAIDKATSGNFEILDNEALAPVAESSTLTREGSEADFHQLGGLAPLRVPSNSSTTSNPTQANSASGYWGNNKSLFPEQDHNASMLGTMESHTILEETEENVVAELVEDEEVHPYYIEEEAQGPPRDIERIDLAGEFQETDETSKPEPETLATAPTASDADKSPTAFSEREESMDETVQTPLLNSPVGAQQLSPSQQTDAGSTSALLASEPDTHNPMMSDPETNSVASSCSPKSPAKAHSQQLTSPVAEKMDRGTSAFSSTPGGGATNDKRETSAKKSSCLCC